MHLSVTPDTTARIPRLQPEPVRLPFQVGARTLFALTRNLVKLSLPLEQQERAPDLPTLPSDADGYAITSLRADRQPAVEAQRPQLRCFVRMRYQRHYASLEGGYETYLGQFSSKTRSTLKRKTRKLAERSGGELDFRSYAQPHEMAEFYRHARSVSALTYQERLLGAGLPEGEAALDQMRMLAAAGSMRGWLLFLEGRPISYLYAPADGDTLIYAYLGYDPAFAEFSPGTVLQLEAMRELMAEGRFRLFDFTEGDGQHKRQFATGCVDCVDLLLLRPTVANLAAGHLLNGFDATVAATKRFSPRLAKFARARLR